MKILLKGTHTDTMATETVQKEILQAQQKPMMVAILLMGQHTGTMATETVQKEILQAQKPMMMAILLTGLHTGTMATETVRKKTQKFTNIKDLEMDGANPECLPLLR